MLLKDDDGELNLNHKPLRFLIIILVPHRHKECVIETCPKPPNTVFIFIVLLGSLHHQPMNGHNLEEKVRNETQYSLLCTAMYFGKVSSKKK